PEGAARRVQQSIDRGLERERQPARPIGGVSRTRFINPPPGAVPSHFQDRDDETRLLGTFLEDDAKRLITVVGRAGMGKTAVVCRLLKALESGTLPDGETPLPVDGIVYLSETGSYRVNVANLFASLCRLLPDDVVRELDAVYKNPQASAEQKMQALLAAFPRGRVVVLMDNFEDLVDSDTFDILDDELDEALRALLHLPHHAVKVILTTRVRPRSLNLFQPGRQAPLFLDEGLPSPYAENILRAMDADGKVGLQTAPDALLDEARERTNGNPRALEALFAILAADRDTTLPEILSATQALLPETVTEALVGEAFSRLDAAAQRIMQALAVYGHPVSPVAVDYLLQPHLPGVDGAPVLSRLVNRQFARKEKGLYYLHPVDRAYALSRIPKGDALDRFAEEESPFTQFALFHRGANYFEQARKPREEWKSVDDLAPQLAEFDLRCAGQDYDTAASVLLGIDFDYLLLWGHVRLMAQLHERLSDRLNDPSLKSRSVGNLGTAYRSMGQIEKAVNCYEQALAI
ncbi:MAG: AAA family ATPase, partial [Rhodothermales bacterium]